MVIFISIGSKEIFGMVIAVSVFLILTGTLVIYYGS